MLPCRPGIGVMIATLAITFTVVIARLPHIYASRGGNWRGSASIVIVVYSPPDSCLPAGVGELDADTAKGLRVAIKRSGRVQVPGNGWDSLSETNTAGWIAIINFCDLVSGSVCFVLAPSAAPVRFKRSAFSVLRLFL